MCFYERFIQLCEQHGISPTKASLDAGCVKGSASYWKKQYLAGKNPLPETRKIQALAEMFGVSVDYLLCRTDDPIDYDKDGDAIAEIPLTYIEAANGDVKKARAIMLAADRDAQMEAQQRSGKLSRFSKQDAELIFALWGDTDDIDEKDLEDVRRFAAFIKERKKD